MSLRPIQLIATETGHNHRLYRRLGSNADFTFNLT